MEKFQNLPRPAKITVGVFGAGGLMGAGLALGSGGRWKWYFLLALLILLVLVVGGYLLWKVWKKRKKAGQFRKDFGDSNTPQPREISDPGQRARLDDLRKKFEAGVEAYRSRGKDIYTLPATSMTALRSKAIAD